MREERAADAVESGGKALCVGGVGVAEVEGFIVVKDVARRETTRTAQLGTPTSTNQPTDSKQRRRQCH